jgi:hypothetical protein
VAQRSRRDKKLIAFGSKRLSLCNLGSAGSSPGLSQFGPKKRTPKKKTLAASCSRVVESPTHCGPTIARPGKAAQKLVGCTEFPGLVRRSGIDTGRTPKANRRNPNRQSLRLFRAKRDWAAPHGDVVFPTLRSQFRVSCGLEDVRSSMSGTPSGWAYIAYIVHTHLQQSLNFYTAKQLPHVSNMTKDSSSPNLTFISWDRPMLGDEIAPCNNENCSDSPVE